MNMGDYSKGNGAGRQSVEMLQNVRVFIASPGDVAKEREYLREVADKINQSIAHEFGFNLEIVGWETQVIPDMGQRPQSIINKQIGSYDIFVGIMWKRFGTPTGEAESGTEEEFNLAFDCCEKFGTPRIMFYFNQEPFMPRDQNDLKQMGKVIEFRDRLFQEGLAWYYEGAEKFKGVIDIHLSKLIVQWTKQSKRETSKIEKRTALYPYFAHPYPMQENFVGRQKERSLLLEWLEKDPTPMLSLVAVGGMGKSALSWYWLNEDLLKKGKKFDGVIWWSFYDKDSSFERFLENSISYASGGKVNLQKIESTGDKMQIFFDLFRNANFLLVLDGLERLLRAYADSGSPYQGDTVKDDEKQDFRVCTDPNVAKFLQWLSAGYPRTKTLITTRLFPKELDVIAGCRRVNLEIMDKEDALEFFKRQGVKGTRAEIEDVCSAYGFHPLSLRLLSGMIVHDMKYGDDVKVWTKYNPLPELVPKEHHILELAYNSLDEKNQAFISRVSAFRTPMDYDAISIFNDFDSEDKFNEVLIELVDRGMLFRDEKSNKFDLHPIVRMYCYERLKDKEGVHTTLMDYFATIPEPEKIESVDDLAPVIELYYHTVRAGRYDKALVLYSKRFCDLIYYRFGAYQTIIELLSALFPDGVDKLPRLKYESSQAWALNQLANSYALSGRPRSAISLLELGIEISKKQDGKKNLATDLANLASTQMKIGELNWGEANHRRMIEISRESKNEYEEAIGPRELGRLLAYRGKFEESENELITALELFTKLDEVQPQCVVWAYRSIRSLLMSRAGEALKSAEKARELADVRHYEIDVIRAEWLLGAAYLMKGNCVEADKHLTEALTRDRKINLVELEPDILLEFAKLRFKENHKKEALKHAEEALQIADRCEYRLKQADIHNFLAEFYRDADDLKQAKKHGETAKERAECGYKPALEKAEKLLKDIERG